MRYELFIGLRYLQARRRETFISLITVISVLGVMIGVRTRNVVMAVMSCVEENLIQQVSKENGVVAATPTIYGQVMLTAGSRVSGVVVRGIDPDRVNRVVNVQSF